MTALAEVAVSVVVALLAVRLAALGFLRGRDLQPRIARDVFITQSTPNVFLWFAIAGGLVHNATGYLALVAPMAAGGFFLAMFADEFFFVRQHTRGLRLAITRVGGLAATADGRVRR